MASSLARAVTDLKGLSRRVVVGGAQRFEQIAKASAARATRSGKAKRHDRDRRVTSVDFGTTETIVSGPGGAVATVDGLPGGPWVWIEFGTKEHSIGAPGQLLGERLDHPVYGPVIHPGIIGRRAWSEAIRQFDAEFGRDADAIIGGVA